MLIVSPGRIRVIHRNIHSVRRDSGAILDIDYLEFNELEVDYLVEDALEFTELDIPF